MLSLHTHIYRVISINLHRFCTRPGIVVKMNINNHYAGNHVLVGYFNQPILVLGLSNKVGTVLTYFSYLRAFSP